MKKALILGTWHHAPYHPFQEVDALLEELLRKDFEVSLTDQLPDLQKLKTGDYALLISYLDAFDETFPVEAAETVMDFVGAGGGLLCLHNGISMQTSDRIFHLIGGRFLRHPQQAELTFKTAATGILSDLPEFSFQEEPYQFEMSGEPITPLLLYQYDGLTFLGGWSREEGRGRVAFLTPGHSIETFRQKAYQAMILRCARWAGQV